MFRSRRPRTRPLGEAEAYARCHGDRSNDVTIVRLPPRPPRYVQVLRSGEELRRRFEERLDRREQRDAPSP